MKTFFREEMFVTTKELTIPSHEKAYRLLNKLQQNRKVELVANFPSIKASQWEGIHASEYLQRVFAVEPDLFVSASIPISQSMAKSVQYSSASFIAATFAALETGCAFSPTAGFHHAHWSQPGVFCLLNVLPLAARLALSEPSIGRVLILDCDYHRGNGTEDILARLDNDRIVHKSFGFKFSRISQSKLYLQEIEIISQSIQNAEFDLVIYQAGMDVLIGDPAGGGILSDYETLLRDELVFSASQQGGVPIVWNLAGGYLEPDEFGNDRVVEAHLKTYDIAVENFG